MKTITTKLYDYIWLWMLLVFAGVLVWAGTYDKFTFKKQPAGEPLPLNVLFISLDNARTNTKLYGY
ncbi:hypothetical protein JW979_03920, partial [bacterium]|nr:hypothetical protein [candidate division CSSED10-310 bacterium]